MAQLQEKILLVTGASQGIGEQVAKAYAAAGATVVLVARHQKKLEKVYDEIVAAGGPEPFAICFDLLSAEEAEFERLAATIAEATGGRLDGIVHCASYFYARSPTKITEASADCFSSGKKARVSPIGATVLMRYWFTHSATVWKSSGESA